MRKRNAVPCKPQPAFRTARESRLHDAAPGGALLSLPEPAVRSTSDGSTSRANPSDLLGFLLVRPQQIQNHVADPGGVKCPDLLGDHLRRAKSAVAFCRFTKVHGVTNAQGLGRAVQCLFVGVVETCGNRRWPVPNDAEPRPACSADLLIAFRAELYVSGVTT